MPPIYKGPRDPEQEAEDKRRKHTSEREALDYAAVSTRAAFLKHMGKIRPGQIAPPAWETYRNSPGVSGNSAMTDYILRYNAENPQRPFQPEVYLPQARPAARAVAPAAAPSRVMANAPAVGVQVDPAAAKKAITDGPFGNGLMDPWAAMANAGFAEASPQVRDEAVNKRIVTPEQALTASRADASPPNTRPASAPTSTTPRPPGIRDDGEVAIQKFLRNEIANMNPDNRPGAKVGWAGYGGTGLQLVSAVDRNGMEYSDAKRAASNRMYEARVDAYNASLSPGQKASTAGYRAWNKANPVNSYIESLDSSRAADAATAPRAVTSRAPVDYTGGAPAFARLEGSTPPATDPSASATMPNGKVERTVFTRPSATPTTDAVTSAGLGLDAFRNIMPGAGLAMTAGAMGAGATNTRGGSMIAKAITPDEIAKRNGDDLAAQFKFNPNAPLPTRSTEEQNQAFNSMGGTPLPPGSNTTDPNSIASQAKAATNATAPQPITSAVKTEGAGAADGGQPGIGSRIVFPALKASSETFTGLGFGAAAKKAAGTGNAGDLTFAGSRLYDRTEVSPMDALISPKVGYGANAPSAIASAQSYQAANPGIKFTNKVDDETLSAKYPIVNSNKEDTGSEADFDAYRKLITTYPEGRSTSAGNQDATIAHELLHGTQPRPMDTPSVIARAKEAIRTRNDTLANSSTDAEAGARLPRLNRAWVNAGNSFPQNTDDAAKIYSAFGIHPPGKPSTASPPQGWDQDPANRDIKNMIKSYRLMPKRKQREFYDKWLPQQPGLASRDRSNGFESAA